jgi:hypothetical protein
VDKPGGGDRLDPARRLLDARQLCEMGKQRRFWMRPTSQRFHKLHAILKSRQPADDVFDPGI